MANSASNSPFRSPVGAEIAEQTETSVFFRNSSVYASARDACGAFVWDTLAQNAI